MAVSIEKIYEDYKAASDAITALNAQIKDLEGQKKAAEAVLLKSIPENGVKSKIQHLVTTRKTPSYGQILKEVRERFVAKSKNAEVECIIENFTTVSTIHKFKAIE